LARFTLDEPYLEFAQQALMAETDWQEWINQIELHGLSGFANKHLEEHDLPLPDALIMPLKALKIRHASASEARFQTLLDMHAIFAEHKLPYLALKGAALMPYLYKEGYLRPMRDMDILMPEHSLNRAAECLREIGFNLPEEQPTKFMRGMHQLPNATKMVNGFLSSVELHRDALSREIVGNLFYPDSPTQMQTIQWQGIEFQALEDVLMLHQVTRHLEGLHSGAVLKLINVMDVIGLAQKVLENGGWTRLCKQFPHVINTLCCLHLLTPLPKSLQHAIAELSAVDLPKLKPSGVGQIMGSLSSILIGKKPLSVRLKQLLLPSDWWLLVYYNVHPDASLLWVKSVRHPIRVGMWLARRIYSKLVGG
jgi:hypothetical protein